MDTILSTRNCIDAIYSSLKIFGDRDAFGWISKALEEAGGDPSLVQWDERPGHSGSLAVFMEDRCSRSTDSSEAFGLNNSATMIRVLAGGEALAGEEFDWQPFESATGFTACGPGGTSWDISPHRHPRGEGSWGITVARWDRPDWITSSCERAMCIAEQVAARPAFPKATHITEHLHMD